MDNFKKYMKKRYRVLEKAYGEKKRGSNPMGDLIRVNAAEQAGFY